MPRLTRLIHDFQFGNPDAECCRPVPSQQPVGSNPFQPLNDATNRLANRDQFAGSVQPFHSTTDTSEDQRDHA